MAKNTKLINSRLKAIHDEIESCNKKTNLLRKQISEIRQASQELKALSLNVGQIESTYRRKNVSQMFKLNLVYKTDKEKIPELKKKVGSFCVKHLEDQLDTENATHKSLNESLERIEAKMKNYPYLKELEKKLLKKLENQNYRQVEKKEDSITSKQKRKVVKRIQRFKNSSGGSSVALTSKSSTWTVKKR